MCEKHYITRWRAPNNPYRGTSERSSTMEAAEKQLKDDIDYFYDNIEIQLVEVTEKVIKTAKGSHPKERS